MPGTVHNILALTDCELVQAIAISSGAVENSAHVHEEHFNLRLVILTAFLLHLCLVAKHNHIIAKGATIRFDTLQPGQTKVLDLQWQIIDL